MRFINIYTCKQLFHIGSHHQVRGSQSNSDLTTLHLCMYVCVYACVCMYVCVCQGLTSVQAGPLRKNLVAVSETGNILIYDVNSLEQGGLVKVRVKKFFHENIHPLKISLHVSIIHDL